MTPVNSNTLAGKIYIEQVVLLYSKPPARTLLHIIPGVAIYWLIREYASAQSALIWIGLLLLINGYRFIDITMIRNRINTVTDFKILELKFALGTALAGIAYGAGLYLFLPLVPPLYQITLLTVLITVIPGAMVSFSTSKKSFLCFLLPALCLPLIQFLILNDSFHFYFAMFGFIYLMVVVTLFNWHYAVLAEAINLRLTNQELVLSLSGTNKQLEALSTLDSLTNLSNRRHFDDVLERELLRAQRAKTPISLILLDIDFFKQYNDEYGHVAGDNCLRLISTVLQETVKRPGDMVARYGGEEFCIIMPDTDQSGAESLAEQIQNEVEILRIPHVKSSVADHVTVSIGTATTVPGLQVTASMLINAADKALYIAKNSGRNQIRSSNIAST